MKTINLHAFLTTRLWRVCRVRTTEQTTHLFLSVYVLSTMWRTCVAHVMNSHWNLDWNIHLALSHDNCDILIWSWMLLTWCSLFSKFNLKRKVVWSKYRCKNVNVIKFIGYFVKLFLLWWFKETCVDCFVLKWTRMTFCRWNRCKFHLSKYLTMLRGYVFIFTIDRSILGIYRNFCLLVI